MDSFNKARLMSTVDIQAAADSALIITSYMDLSGRYFDFHCKMRKVGSWICENKKKKDVASRIDLFDSEQDMSNWEQDLCRARNCNIESKNAGAGIQALSRAKAAGGNQGRSLSFSAYSPACPQNMG